MWRRRLRLQQKYSKREANPLIVNKEKTKYMILSRKNYNQQRLVVNRMLCERVITFEYLGVELSANEIIINPTKI